VIADSKSTTAAERYRCIEMASKVVENSQDFYEKDARVHFRDWILR
jgi:hypothetical protein